MTAQPSQRVFGLDLMRFFAIMFVVCTHTLWAFPSAEGSLVSLLKLSGVMGVEIFFVLSGFLIGRILFKIFTQERVTSKSLLYFLIRRWFRTLPNYYLVLFLNIIVVLYVGRSLPQSLPSYFFFLQNFNTEIALFFTESWSLSIEEFAYIIGPFLFFIVLFFKFSISKKKLFLIVTLAIIAFFLGTKVYYNSVVGSSTLEYWNSHLKAVVLYRIDAIYYGVLAAYVSLVYPLFWKKYTVILLFIGIIFFIGMHAFIGMYTMSPASHPFFLNVLYFPLCSLCIALSLPLFSSWKLAPVWVSTPITFISKVSYGMYLLHYSVILVLLRFWLSPQTFSYSEQWIFAFGYIAITIFMASILYKIFEKPFMDLRDHPYFRHKYLSK